MSDLRLADVFGFEPRYTFPGYRSNLGAVLSLGLVLAVSLRLGISTLAFLTAEPKISENRALFPDGITDPFELPKLGVVFKRTGWTPFYDQSYFRFRFDQGVAGRASNSSYVDLGDEPCGFVDTYGRIVEDAARCPATLGTVLGNYFDEVFHFVRVTLMRCHNGTNGDGRAIPGPCKRPDEIDALIWQGTVTLVIAQVRAPPPARPAPPVPAPARRAPEPCTCTCTWAISRGGSRSAGWPPRLSPRVATARAPAQENMDVVSSQPYQKLHVLKKQFTRNVHATYDVMFTALARPAASPRPGLVFTPLCFTPVFFTPLFFTLLCFTPLCFTPVFPTPLSFTPLSFTPVVSTPLCFTPLCFTLVFSTPLSFSWRQARLVSHDRAPTETLRDPSRNT